MARILAISGDLFFQARISSSAAAVGTDVAFVSPNRVPGNCSSYSVVLVDLEAPGAIGGIESAHGNGGRLIVAFGPHTDTVAFKAARGAGAHRVLARSKLSSELPRLFAKLSREDDQANNAPTGGAA